MVLNYAMGACTGNFFLSGVLDFHKDLLKIKDFGLSAFAYLYIACLKGRTVAESVEEINKQVRENYILRTEIFYLFPFRQGGNPPEDANRFFAALNSLFDANYRPTKMEWFKACFLAYSMAEGRQFNGRIAPMIVFETHLVLSGYADYPITPEDMYDIYREIPYFYALSIIRRPTNGYAAIVSGFTNAKEDRNFIERLSDYLLKKPMGYMDYDDEFLSARAVVRFEDLKLEPKATLDGLLNFLDIEWDDILLKVTTNGIENTMNLGNRKIVGYDTTAVYNLHENVFSSFDTYRIEIVLKEFLKTYGYKPIQYKDGVDYTVEEIKKLFDVRFKCEDIYYSKMQNETNPKAREKLAKYLEVRLNKPNTNAETEKKIVPVKRIMPTEELIEDKLY